MGIQPFPSCTATPLWDTRHVDGAIGLCDIAILGLVQSLEVGLRAVGGSFWRDLRWDIDCVPLCKCLAAGQRKSVAGHGQEGEERDKNVGAHICLCDEETSSGWEWLGSVSCLLSECALARECRTKAHVLSSWNSPRRDPEGRISRGRCSSRRLIESG